MNAPVVYSDASSDAALRPCPGMSQTITVWSFASAGTVVANMWDDAAKPCVSTTTGPSPVTSA